MSNSGTRPYELASTTTPADDAVLIIDSQTAGTKSITPDDLIEAVRPFASTAEAQEGTVDDRVMSPARTAEAIDAQLPNTPTGRSILNANDAAAVRTAIFESTYAAAAAALVAPRTVTGTTATVANNDSMLRFNLTAACAVTLGTIAGRVGQPITLVDIGRNAATYPITITPQSGDTIMGQSTWTIDVDAAALTLHPLTGGTDWFIT